MGMIREVRVEVSWSIPGLALLWLAVRLLVARLVKVALVALVLSLPVLLLWNNCLTGVVSDVTLDFQSAWGLVALVRILLPADDA